MKRAVSAIGVGALVLVQLAWSGVVRAEQTNPHLKEGIQLLKNMEDDRAVAALKKALSWPDNTPEIRAEIHLHLGIAHSNLVNRDAATASFRRALESDPQISLPGQTSPKIRRLFEQARAELEQERRSTPAPTPAPVQPAPPPPRDQPSHMGQYWPAWTALAVTVAAVTTGAILGALSSSAENEASDPALTYDEAKEHHDTAKSRALGANIMFGVGGAAAIATGVLFYVGYRKGERPARTAVIAPVNHGVVVQIGGTL